MAVIRLPTPLRSYAQGKAEVQVKGDNISEALQDLLTAYPTLRPHLFNGEGQLRPFVNLFLGEENVMQMQGLNTPLKENDRLMLIPSIAGGR
jgi:adenylyltransferase/sulfurtransferase